MFGKVNEYLKSETISKEVAEAIDAEISVALGALRDEAKTLRQEKEQLTSSFNDMSSAKSALEDKFVDYDDKIKLAKDEGKADTVKLLEAERAKHKELVDNISIFEKENTKLRLDGAVTNELGKYDIKKDDREMVQFFLRSNTVMTDGNVTYNDGQPLDEAFKLYFGNNTSRLNATGGGNGSGALDGQGSGQANVKSRADFEKLQPGARADFVSKGGTVE